MNPNDRYTIFCPAGRGSINHKTAIAVFEIQKVLIDLGLNHRSVSMMTIQGADIVEARNIAATAAADAAAALREADPAAESWMIGIDDDVGVAPEVARLLIESGLPYAGTCIPQRNNFDFDEFAERLRAEPDKSPAAIAAGISSLVDGGEAAEVGMTEVSMVGAGFFVLRGSALLTMIEKGVVAQKTTTCAAGTTRTYGFYELVYLEEGDGTVRRLSEDYSFCHRLRKAGTGRVPCRRNGVHVGLISSLTPGRNGAYASGGSETGHSSPLAENRRRRRMAKVRIISESLEIDALNPCGNGTIPVSMERLGKGVTLGVDAEFLETARNGLRRADSGWEGGWFHARGGFGDGGHMAIGRIEDMECNDGRLYTMMPEDESSRAVI